MRAEILFRLFVSCLPFLLSGVGVGISAALSIAETGDVMKVELDADAFAAEYLGTETVIAGLVALKKKIIDEYEYDEIPLKEIEQRIKRLEMKKEKSAEI